MSIGSLPSLIVDVDEFQIIVSGMKKERLLRDCKDITRRSNIYEGNEDLCSRYFKIFNRTLPFEEAVFRDFSLLLREHYLSVKNYASLNDELYRFESIEIPVSRYVINSICRGIKINQGQLLIHKKNLEHDFYTALKEYSAKYNVPLEVPDDQDVIEYLEPMGYDFTGVDVDYILKFVPMESNYAKDVLSLRKLSRSRNVLNSIPLSTRRAYPMVDTFGSITSRIYLRDPSLQNLAKKHRNILIPDDRKRFVYVDYDQFEAGIMAALSQDEELLSLYSGKDMYVGFAEKLFNNINMRKDAKRLFLSYAYGMSMKSLIDAAVGFGANRKVAKEIFKSFVYFEKWKEGIWSDFARSGKIGTANGN